MIPDTMTPVQKWRREIESYERVYKTWEQRADKIVKRYRDERTARDGTVRFNILWSNVETLIPAVFSRLPQPEVSRRFKDRDPAGRVAALILERCLEFELHHYNDYAESMANCVKDRYLPGRGVAWVRYEPHFLKVPDPHTPDQEVQEEGTQITEDAEDEARADIEVLDYECTPCDYVAWRDFGHTVARTWEEVTGVWRRVYMSYDELKERFGEEVADGTPLDQRPQDVTEKDSNSQAARVVSKATIYEIWDKSTGKAMWLSRKRDEFLDIRDDPLGLAEFFPCPKPLYATTTTDTLIPIPDYTLYQDQATELDTLSKRIDGLVQSLRVVCIYDASQPALKRLLDETVNMDTIPVDRWTAFAEKGGLKSMVDFLPIRDMAEALVHCYNAREQIKSMIYEVTGLSDIVRGESQASETATAQEIKGRFASLRIKRHQQDVARFAADLLKIKGEIIAKKYAPQTLAQMAGVQQMQEDPQVIMQAMQLLKDEPMRNFRIDVSADSMTQIDEQAEKQARVEFLTATGAFLEKAVAAAQVAPQLMPLLGEMLMFGVRGFKVGKTIESAFDQAMAQMAQPQGPQQPDPKMLAAQTKAQSDQVRAQAEMARAQADMQIAPIQAQSEHAKAQAQVIASTNALREAAINQATGPLQ